MWPASVSGRHFRLREPWPAGVAFEHVAKVYLDGTRASTTSPSRFATASSSSSSGLLAVARRRLCGWSPASRRSARGPSRSATGWSTTPARDRKIAMVFQTYALYPHLSVFENLAFGLLRFSRSRFRFGAREALPSRRGIASGWLRVRRRTPIAGIRAFRRRVAPMLRAYRRRAACRRYLG